MIKAKFDIYIKSGNRESIQRGPKAETIEVYAGTYSRAKHLIKEYIARGGK